MCEASHMSNKPASPATRIAHDGCDHDATKSARSKCRTMRAKVEELAGSPVVGSDDGYQLLGDGRAVKLTGERTFEVR